MEILKLCDNNKDLLDAFNGKFVQKYELYFKKDIKYKVNYFLFCMKKNSISFEKKIL